MRIRDSGHICDRLFCGISKTTSWTENNPRHKTDMVRSNADIYDCCCWSDIAFERWVLLRKCGYSLFIISGSLYYAEACAVEKHYPELSYVRSIGVSASRRYKVIPFMVACYSLRIWTVTDDRGFPADSSQRDIRTG